MSKILSIIAPKNYQDIEYGHSKEALETAGHTIVTASTSKIAEGALGGSVTVDLLLQDVDYNNYDAVLFVGGGGCFDYFDDPLVHNIAQNFFKTDKITAAICAAPSILANAGLLQGINATCYPSQVDNLKKHGANYTGRPVENDGLIITGNGPEAATKFGEEIAQALA